MNANGILIQGFHEKQNHVKKICYQGINAYFQFPLTVMYDDESRKLTNEQQSKKVDDYFYVMLEFISNSDLYNRYVNQCKMLGIKFRALFIESNYSDEIWSDPLPKMELLGYEYCPIPIDEQVITDMDWYEPFSKYHQKLNKYGLFETYEDVFEFSNEYNKAMEDGYIGDGEVDLYICRVYQVIINNENGNMIFSDD